MSDLNTLKNDAFALNILALPHVTMFAQEIEIPGVSLGAANRGSPLVDIPHPGDKLEFETFSVTFMVDEDLTNYMEVDAWIRGLAFPQHSDQFKRIKESTDPLKYTEVSDIKVQLLTNKSNFNLAITFINAWPTSLSSITMAYDPDTPTHPLATVEFQYSIYYYGDGFNTFFNR